MSINLQRAARTGWGIKSECAEGRRELAGCRDGD